MTRKDDEDLVSNRLSIDSQSGLLEQPLDDAGSSTSFDVADGEPIPLPDSALSPAELLLEKKLRRKIDTLIMPIVLGVYLLNYIDRNNYAAARLQGLEQDLNLTPREYQIGLSVFFVGYVLMQVPSNALLNYTGRPSLYLGFWVIAWGLVSACTSTVSSFSGIFACRFILGFVEAPFFPGVLFYLSKWYTKSELSFRMALFYSGSLISGAFGNLIAGAILKGLAGVYGLAAWKWLYIIEGCTTMAAGIVVALYLPDFPHRWTAVSPELRHVAIRRMEIDAAGADVDDESVGNHLRGVKMAFSDPKTYILAIMYHCATGSTGFQNFFPSLTETLGYSKVVSLLLVAPPYLFMVFYSYGHSLLSDAVGARYWFWIYPIPITIMGCIIFMLSDNFALRYFSLFLMIFGFAMNSTIFAWISTCIARPPAKRAAAMAIINSFANTALIWTPFTYSPDSAPHYRLAMSTIIVLLCLCGVFGTVLRQHLAHENRRLDIIEARDGEFNTTSHLTAEQEGLISDQAEGMGKPQRGYRYML